VVVPFEISIDGLTLSGLLAEPAGTPRAVVVALHGHGMTARYFDGPGNPEGSLLELGPKLGFTVWAPDRVGYGASAETDPSRFAMFPQAELLSAAVDRFATHHETGAGCLLVGHSFGLKIALAMAASPPATRLLGVEGSGTGLMYTFEPGVTRPQTLPGDVNPSWGPAHLYPAEVFDPEIRPTAPMASPPPNEVVEWPEDLRGFGHRVQIPVRFTFGDHERLWVTGPEHFVALREVLPSAPRIEFDIQQASGHNVSLSWAARAYHLKSLAFAEDCMVDSRIDSD
jgi:pimeloyl-ACP methyl ester carboxylesterase